MDFDSVVRAAQGGVDSGAVRVDRDPQGVFTQAAPTLGNVNTGSSPSAPAVPTFNQPSFNPNAQLQGSINSRFDQLLQGLDEAKGRLSQTEGKFLGQAQADFATNKQNLERTKGLGLETLGRSRQKVEESKARTLSELDANIRNAMDAGAIRLGNLGAADSSAAGQLGFALTKMQNQNRGNILRDVQQQNLDLDLAQKEVETEFMNQLGSLQNFLQGEKLRIQTQFQQQRELIEAEKRNASFERQEALDNLSLQLAQQAASQITQTQNSVEAQAQNLAADYSKAGINVGNILQPANRVALQAGNTANLIQGQGNVNAGFNLQGGGNGAGLAFSPLAVRRNDENNPLTVSAR